MKALTYFLAIVLFAACTNEDVSPGTSIPYAEGLTTNFITVDNVSRKYLVYRPNETNEVKAVVMVLHGGGGLGLNVSELGTHPLSVFRSLADQEKFLVVYPEGSLDIQENPGWNDCREDDTSGSQGNDLEFLKQLNTKLTTELKIGADKMFLSGTSNGALMTFAYAFHYPETISAIAVSSGNLPRFPESGICASGSVLPIPVLLTHGTSDPAMPADGGCVANLGNACNRGEVISQAETLNYWINRNGLQNVNPSVTMINVSQTDAGDVEKRVYNGPNPIVYFILNNAGHSVASKTVFLSSSPANGIQNRDIEFAEEVWEFFIGL
ncbi:MAG: hypothetical protein MUF68_00315 [Cyclobacteriaceae bacterium]|jgi:polyhydroxybutyrate depolymerase|nr:hypothetical protein [Cyclobacteriaceae bacterium]